MLADGEEGRGGIAGNGVCHEVAQGVAVGVFIGVEEADVPGEGAFGGFEDVVLGGVSLILHDGGIGSVKTGEIEIDGAGVELPLLIGGNGAEGHSVLEFFDAVEGELEAIDIGLATEVAVDGEGIRAGEWGEALGAVAGGFVEGAETDFEVFVGVPVEVAEDAEALAVVGVLVEEGVVDIAVAFVVVEAEAV